MLGGLSDHICPWQATERSGALLGSKAALKTASGGADLLKRKRDALIGEFFALVKDALAAREDVVSFAGGIPDPELFDDLTLRTCEDGQAELQEMLG